MAHGALVSITKGREPWSFYSPRGHRDCDETDAKEKYKPIEYPKHDNVLTFDLLTNLARSGVNHDHD